MWQRNSRWFRTEILWQDKTEIYPLGTREPQEIFLKNEPGEWFSDDNLSTVLSACEITIHLPECPITLCGCLPYFVMRVKTSLLSCFGSDTKDLALSVFHLHSGKQTRHMEQNLCWPRSHAVIQTNRLSSLVWLPSQKKLGAFPRSQICSTSSTPSPKNSDIHLFLWDNKYSFP